MGVAVWQSCAHCVYAVPIGRTHELKCGIMLPSWVSGSSVFARYVGDGDGCSLGVMRDDPELEAVFDQMAGEALYGQQ